ncbi:MAG: 2-C-methyl-D-erythritol 4-phosphate cytidylyltransferase [Acidimicrobiia bacterium]
MTVWAVVVAAGGGTRFGGAKQFERLGTARVVDHAVAAAERACDAVVVVVPPGSEWDGVPVAASVPGGATRSASVRAGLDAVPDSVEIVVVHDAARPLATTALFGAVIAAVRGGADGAVPGVEVTDTLKQLDDDRVVATIPREGVVAVQTPQAFRAEILRQAHLGDVDASDDAALVEASGGRVVIVAGEAANRKITAPEDLGLAAALLATRMDR